MVGITPEDAVDNFAILAALAGKGAELATGRITPDELRDLRDLAAAIDDADDVVEANRRFHRAINLAARSPRLLTYVRQAQRVVPGNYFELFPEQAKRSRREHAPLLDAMERGDAAEARRYGGARAQRRRGAGRLARRDRRRRRRRRDRSPDGAAGQTIIASGAPLEELGAARRRLGVEQPLHEVAVGHGDEERRHGAGDVAREGPGPSTRIASMMRRRISS